MTISDPDDILTSLRSGTKAARISVTQSDGGAEIDELEFEFNFINRCETTTFELDSTTVAVVNHQAGDTDTITTALSSLLIDSVSSESDGDGYLLCSSLRHYYFESEDQ